MKKRIFLILSPIRETYPENYKGTIVFLGNKDHQYIKKKNPEATIKNIETLWSNKDKLNLDLNYLSDIEKNYFKEIGLLINKKNKNNFDEKYWSIFLRPSVFAILTFLYERWIKIDCILQNYEIENCNFLNLELHDFISFDMDKLYKKIYYDDTFNQIIFQNILESNNLKFEKKEYFKNEIDVKLRRKKNFFFFIKKLKISNILYFFKLILRNINNFILLLDIKKKNFTYITSNIGNSELRSKLNSYFKQKNFVFKIKNIKKNEPVDLNLRNYLNDNLSVKSKNDFEEFFLSKIFKILPKNFIENYKHIQKKNFKITKNFKFDNGIILYDQLYSNDFCELDWIAKNYMSGSKLILAQNGGGWFTANCSTIKLLMKNFKFKELSFGTEDEIKKNIYGVGIYRFHKEKKIFKKNGKIIYALYIPYGYSGLVRSNAPIGDEWIGYMKKHEEFITNLKDEIKKEIILRPKKRYLDYYNFKDKLEKKFPENLVEEHSSRPLKDLLIDARLLITTLDTTTILQGLALNFPTILICDLKKLNINVNYLSYYKILQDAEILFDDFSDAKFHIEKIFSDVEGWWKKSHVQEAREIFCKKFAYHPENQPTYFVKKLSEIKF